MPATLVTKRLPFLLAASGFCLLGSTAAIADAHSDRQALMQSNRTTTAAIDSLVVGILDVNKVKAQARILIANGAKIATLFGPGTDQNDPGTKPAIWTDAAGFKAADDKFIADANAFLTAPDRIALATTLVTVQADCTSCHQAYRITAPPPAAVANAAAPPVQVAVNTPPANAPQAQGDQAAAGANAAGGNAAGGGRRGAAGAAAAAQGGFFNDRSPSVAPAAATIKAKVPTIALEVSAAQLAARSGSRNIGRIDDIHNRMQRAINCLEGPKGADFDATVLNPCADSGNGVIPDTSDADKKAKYQDVIVKLKSGLTVTTRQDAQQVALDSADMIVSVSGG